jgi:colicin import membrane protein
VIKLYVDREGGSKDGALAQQQTHETELRVREEAARVEAEARAAREKEAEEAARIAIERAQARQARAEEEARAREEARKAGGEVVTDTESETEPADSARKKS